MTDSEAHDAHAGSQDELPRRCVLHRHALHDGGWHFDWMIEPAGGLTLEDERVDSKVLLSLRVTEVPGQFDRHVAVRAPDHRASYLDHIHGEDSKGLGVVERLLVGHVIHLEAFRGGEDETGWLLRVRWLGEDAWTTIHGERIAADEAGGPTGGSLDNGASDQWRLTRID